MSTTSQPDSAAAAVPAPVELGAPEAVPAPAAWSIEAAKALYNIEGWGDGHFDVNAAGRVIVRPDKDHPQRTVDLYELAHDLEAQGVALPVLLRISDILK